MAISLLRLMKRQGKRRRVVKLKPIKTPNANRLELAAIALEMVRFLRGHVDELLAAYRVTDLEPEQANPARMFDSTDDLDRLIQLIVTQTQTVMTRLQLKVLEWGKKAETRHRSAFVSAVQSGTGINLETVLDPNNVSETVGAAVTRATNLIRDIGDEQRKRLGDIVLNGVQQRIPTRTVAKQIADSFDMSDQRALNIAADQSVKLNSALDRARQIEVGMPGFIWRHSGKVHARPEHLARDGEFFEWESSEIEPGDFPGEPPFCGCIAQGVLTDDEGELLEGFEDARTLADA